MAEVLTPNPHRGQLGFDLDGDRWVFAFTTNALCAVEEEFGLNDISELGTILGGKPSLRHVRTLFRIGLTDVHPDMSDHEAGKIMEAVGGLEPSLELIMRAVNTAFPEAAETGTSGPRTAARKAPKGLGTGPRSTSRGARAG